VFTLDERYYHYIADSQPEFFYHNITSDLTSRYFYTIDNYETFLCFIPKSTENHSLFTFTITDLTGRLGEENCYLESLVSINGSTYILERDIISGETPQAQLTLLHHTCYVMRIRWADGTHTYFYYCTQDGSDTSYTFVVTEEPWEDSRHRVDEYITMTATRPNATHIQMFYNDTTYLAASYYTTNVTWVISYRNATVVYSNTTLSTQEVTRNWYSADNETDYIVDLYADHQWFGDIHKRWVLDASRSFGALPDLDAFGTWGGLPTENIIAIVVGLILMGTCTFVSAPFAPFLFMVAQAAFKYWGGTTYTTTQIIIGFAIAILLGLVISGRSR
jgi:hypothetical protein